MQTKNKSAAIIKGTLSLSLSALLVKILGVIYKIPLSYILGEEGMGYFNSAYTIYGFFYILCTAGVSKAIALIVTEAEHIGLSVKKIYRQALGIFLLLGSVVTVLFILCAPYISNIIGSKNSYASIIVIGPSLIFTALAGVMRGLLNGKMRLYPIAVSQFIEALLKLVLGILFAKLGTELGLGLPMISALSILGITIGSFFGCAYLYFACIIKDADVKSRQNKHYTTKELCKKIFKITIPISLGSAVFSFSNILDLGIIMRRLLENGVSEPVATALYGNYSTLSIPMINLVISILTPITLAAMPTLAEKSMKKDKSGFATVLRKTLCITTYLAAPCFAVFYFYSFDILDILFTSSSAATGAEMFRILSFGAFLMPLLTVVNTAHEAMGAIKTSVISLLIGCIVKGIVTYLLVGNGSIGINGAPIGTVASYIVSIIISIVMLKKRRLSLNIFTSVVAPVFLSLISFGIPFVLIYERGLIAGGIKSMLFILVPSAIIYLISVAIFFYIRTKSAHLLTKLTKKKCVTK